jgi:uncharacterized membrane protein
MAERIHWLGVLPALRARPHLLVAMAVGGAVYAALAGLTDLPAATRTLLAWNAGALLYLLLAWEMMRVTDKGEIERRAASQDEGRLAILAIVVLAAAVILLAVGSQLSQVRELHGLDRVGPVLLAVLTVLTSWLFMQVLFALHYAHDFYAVRRRGGTDPLEFKGTPEPGYGDFFHFACVIGTAAQTADVSFVGSALRPIGTVHCIVSFFFNASLLALAINVVAGALV